jgi:hypothetical protein
MKALLAALLLAVAPAAPSEQNLIGIYRLSQMEMGGGLQLTPDGRFRYELDYGAVSEAAEGRWSLDLEGVHLESEPMDKRLLSELERSDASFKNQLLRIEGDTLIMNRYDARMTFRPLKQ